MIESIREFASYQLLPICLMLPIFILLTSWTNSFGQGSSKSYIGRGVVHGPTYCYRVTTIDINSDSTYLRKDFGCGNKKSWKEYLKWEVEISGGKIKKWRDYYRMTEYRNNAPTVSEFKLRMTERKMIFWYVDEMPKRRFKGLVLKTNKLK